MINRFPVACCVLCLAIAASGAGAQAQLPVLSPDQLDQQREHLLELESRDGRFHFGLVEPLARFAETAMALHQYDEAGEAVDRAVQIARIAQGLYTDAQFPLLTLKVENDVRRNNWEDANETLEHLYWLYTNKHRGIDEAVVYELQQLANFHLEAVGADVADRQAYHFRNAVNISWVAMRVGELIWGESDPRQAPLLYNLAKQYFLQSVALDRGDGTAFELREVVPGSGWVRPRQTVKRAYYLTGLRLLSDMQEIFADGEHANAEAAGLASVYIADWQLLFTHEDAAQAYTAAYEQLLAAGVESGEIEQFFARPQILPAREFHLSLAAAEQSRLDRAAAFPEVAARDLYLFDEWTQSMPNVEFPLPSAGLSFVNRQDAGFAVLTFDLGPLEKVSRWVNGRYVTRMGVPENIEILEQVANPALELKGFAEKVHSLHFRPRLIGGEPESVTGTLYYLLSSQ